MDRLENLLLRWQDGTLRTKERAELVEFLKQPGARKRLAEDFLVTYGIQEAIIGEEAEREESKANDVEEAEHHRKIRAKRRTRSTRFPVRGPKSNFRISLAVAAGVAMVLGIGILLWGNGSARQDLVVEQQAPRRIEPFASEVNQASAAGLEPVAPVPKAPSPLRLHAEETAEPEPVSPAPSERSSQPPSVPPIPRLAHPRPESEVAAKRGSEVKPEVPSPASKRPSPGSELETERPIARIARIEGLVRYARGAKGRWAKAIEGVRLLAGDRLETPSASAKARLDFEGGVTVYVNRRAVLRILTVKTDVGKTMLVHLSKGEIYVEDEGVQKVHVETQDGLFSPMGTRFDVNKTPLATLVAVEAGTVAVRAKAKRKKTEKSEAQNETIIDSRPFSRVEKAVRVETGYQSRVRAGRRPTTPAKISKSWSTRWIHRLRKRRVMDEGFERFSATGVPEGWWHKILPGITFSVERKHVRGGAQALRIRDENTQQQGKFRKIIDEPLLSNLRGKKVRFSVWMKAMGASVPKAYISICGESWGHKKAGGGNFIIETRWKRYSVEHAIPPDLRNSFTLWICVSGNEAVGVVVVDEMRLEVVEP